VSRRIAAHQSRQGFSAVKPAAPKYKLHSNGSRAAQAAARVAARYAGAPGYSQTLIAESPAASPAAEIAIEAVLEPQASVQTVPAAPLLWEPEAPLEVAPVRPSVQEREPNLAATSPAGPQLLPTSLEAWESEDSYIRWKPAQRLHPLESSSGGDSVPISARAIVRSLQPAESFPPPAEIEWERPVLSETFSESEAIEPVEPDQPIHANLIEFPRELVATRKMRPRRIEGAYAEVGLERQLSIFEVIPEAISIQPVATAAVSEWPEPVWSEIALSAQSPQEPEESEAPQPLDKLYLAPVGPRLSASLVDSTIIAAIFLASAVASSGRIGHPPARVVELGAVSALLLIGLVYHAVFLLLGKDTAGMRCAKISLCTFDDRIPTRAELRCRLGGLLLSLVPVGLGVLWVLFDEDHLCWHDRLSKTYLREC
jgi:uncharacterized RDD family membrane protein YckC